MMAIIVTGIAEKKIIDEHIMHVSLSTCAYLSQCDSLLIQCYIWHCYTSDKYYNDTIMTYQHSFLMIHPQKSCHDIIMIFMDVHVSPKIL